MTNGLEADVRIGASLVALSLLLIGCEDREPIEGTNTLAPTPLAPTAPVGQGGGPPVLELDARFTRVAEATCDYEARCGHVGENTKYADRRACVTDQRAQLADELATSACGPAVDGNAMSKCLTAIDDSKCDDPVDTTRRVQACRAGLICVRDIVP
jgi:hypothetical protein